MHIANSRATTTIFFFLSVTDNFLLDKSPEAREIETKIYCWDYIKIKSFCTGRGKKKSTKPKGTYGMGEDICKWHK